MDNQSLTPDTRHCPQCNADWQGQLIPEKSRHVFAGGGTHFSRLIGVEMGEDRVDHWLCPDCAATFPRNFRNT